MWDFNIDILTSNKPQTKRFVDLLRSFGLELLVNSSTRVTSSSETAVDSIVSDVTVSVVVTGISYHYDQEAVISGVKFERGANIRHIRLSNIDLLNFCLIRKTGPSRITIIHQ